MSGPISPSDREAVLQKYMDERGLKSTRQRHLIVDTFFAFPGHW